MESPTPSEVQRDTTSIKTLKQLLKDGIIDTREYEARVAQVFGRHQPGPPPTTAKAGGGVALFKDIAPPTSSRDAAEAARRRAQEEASRQRRQERRDRLVDAAQVSVVVAGTPQTEGPKKEANPRKEAVKSPRKEAVVSPRKEATGSPRNEAVVSPRGEASASLAALRTVLADPSELPRPRDDQQSAGALEELDALLAEDPMEEEEKKPSVSGDSSDALKLLEELLEEDPDVETTGKRPVVGRAKGPSGARVSLTQVEDSGVEAPAAAAPVSCVKCGLPRLLVDGELAAFCDGCGTRFGNNVAKKTESSPPPPRLKKGGQSASVPDNLTRKGLAAKAPPPPSAGGARPQTTALRKQATVDAVGSRGVRSEPAAKALLGNANDPERVAARMELKERVERERREKSAAAAAAAAAAAPVVPAAVDAFPRKSRGAQTPAKKAAVVEDSIVLVVPELDSGLELSMADECGRVDVVLSVWRRLTEWEAATRSEIAATLAGNRPDAAAAARCVERVRALQADGRGKAIAAELEPLLLALKGDKPVTMATVRLTMEEVATEVGDVLEMLEMERMEKELQATSAAAAAATAARGKAIEAAAKEVEDEWLAADEEDRRRSQAERAEREAREQVRLAREAAVRAQAEEEERVEREKERAQREEEERQQLEREAAERAAREKEERQRREQEAAEQAAREEAERLEREREAAERAAREDLERIERELQMQVQRVREEKLAQEEKMRRAQKESDAEQAVVVEPKWKAAEKAAEKKRLEKEQQEQEERERSERAAAERLAEEELRNAFATSSERIAPVARPLTEDDFDERERRLAASEARAVDKERAQAEKLQQERREKLERAWAKKTAASELEIAVKLESMLAMSDAEREACRLDLMQLQAAHETRLRIQTQEMSELEDEFEFERRMLEDRLEARRLAFERDRVERQEERDKRVAQAAEAERLAAEQAEQLRRQREIMERDDKVKADEARRAAKREEAASRARELVARKKKELEDEFSGAASSPAVSATPPTGAGVAMDPAREAAIRARMAARAAKK